MQNGDTAQGVILRLQQQQQAEHIVRTLHLQCAAPIYAALLAHDYHIAIATAVAERDKEIETYGENGDDSKEVQFKIDLDKNLPLAVEAAKRLMQRCGIPIS